MIFLFVFFHPGFSVLQIVAVSWYLLMLLVALSQSFLDFSGF